MFAYAPLNAFSSSITEPPDIIIVPIHWTGGGKQQSVTRETGSLDNHDLFPEATVHLDEKSDRSEQ